MKNTVFIILIFLGAQLAIQAQNASDIKYEKFYYENGKVSSEGILRDGKPDGIWISYYRGGQIKSKGKRSNFLLDSVWKFYDEMGNLTEEINYLKGKKSGFLTRYQGVVKNNSLTRMILARELFLDDEKEGQGFYYDDYGQIEQIVSYKQGKKHGLSRWFNSDSLIQTLYKYHNDFLIDREFINQYNDKNLKQGLWKKLYDNDNIMLEENYNNGILHGYYREYSRRGQLLVSKFYEYGKEIERIDDEKIKIEIRNQFDSKGQIAASGGFINNTPVGIHRKYTDNRSVINTTEYSNSGQIVSDGITDEKGKKDEFWKFYYNTGQLKSEGSFNNNIRHGVWKYYFPNQQLEQTGSFRSGREDGLWTWFYEDGSLRREENYYRSLEDGASVEFDKNGNIIAKGDYIEGLKEGIWYYHVGDHTEKGAFIAGEKDGIWEHFYMNGIKKFSGAYLQGYANGKHKYFYENGKIKEEQYFEMGRKEKTWKKIDETGNISITTSYSNDRIVKINGVKINLEELR
ncbi:MAG: hypothetical protein KAH17_03010 [Bacteroidales bacterium]|nr:hypothetical protein [Bacteroidales bacterium]